MSLPSNINWTLESWKPTLASVACFDLEQPIGKLPANTPNQSEARADFQLRRKCKDSPEDHPSPPSSPSSPLDWFKWITFTGWGWEEKYIFFGAFSSIYLRIWETFLGKKYWMNFKFYYSKVKIRVLWLFSYFCLII